MSDESGPGLLTETPGWRQQAVVKDARDGRWGVKSRPQRGRGAHCWGKVCVWNLGRKAWCLW